MRNYFSDTRHPWASSALPRTAPRVVRRRRAVAGRRQGRALAERRRYLDALGARHLRRRTRSGRADLSYSWYCCFGRGGAGPTGRTTRSRSSSARPSRVASSPSCCGSSAAISDRSWTASAFGSRSRCRRRRSLRSSRSSARGFTKKCSSGSGCSPGCTECYGWCACRCSRQYVIAAAVGALAFAYAHHIGPYGEPDAGRLLRVPRHRRALLHAALRRSAASASRSAHTSGTTCWWESR